MCKLDITANTRQIGALKLRIAAIRGISTKDEGSARRTPSFFCIPARDAPGNETPPLLSVRMTRGQ
jgi:hypothetical protein